MSLFSVPNHTKLLCKMKKFSLKLNSYQEAKCKITFSIRKTHKTFSNTVFLPLKHVFFSNVEFHMVTEWLRLDSSCPTLLLKQVTQSRSPRTISRQCLSISSISRWRLHSFSRQPVPLFSHLSSLRTHPYICTHIYFIGILYL